jgi:hypothetical protein
MWYMYSYSYIWKWVLFKNNIDWYNVYVTDINDCDITTAIYFHMYLFVILSCGYVQDDPSSTAIYD